VRLPGARVLLTGATGGIGQAVADALHERGARLILTGRRVEVLEPLARRTGARVLAADLADPAQLDRLVEEAGPVDVLVANAAVPAGGAIWEHSAGDIDNALQVNLRAPMVLARVLSPAMVAAGGGHILFMSSLAGKAASPGGAVYSATKFGLRGFALGLREDLAPHGVGVSVVLPGFISEAGMFADSGARLPRFVGTKPPEAVAAAVIAAIEHDRAEIDVAPWGLRAGALVAGIVPGLSARVQRRVGAAEMSASISDGQARARAAATPVPGAPVPAEPRPGGREPADSPIPDAPRA
jgi:short-subunit dehydrogenase